MTRLFAKRGTTAILTMLLTLPLAQPAQSLDLIPDRFKKTEVKSTVWELNEQYVGLVEIEPNAPPNDHPVIIDAIEIEHALASLELWIEGGILRDEEATNLYPRKQAALIASYLHDALARAAPNEDVAFNVRGYADVMLSLVREREWTTGRVFYKDGRLNLIIGEYGKRMDKGKKNVEGSFGITEDFRDVHFQLGSRNHKGKMPGRVVNTAGIEVGKDGRPDWIVIDVAQAALAYREAQVPAAVRKEELKAKAEAAKLTLERRQMREEMARMRKELQEMQDNGASSQSLEERLAKLQQLHDKGLIDDADFQRRKDQILSEI